MDMSVKFLSFKLREIIHLLPGILHRLKLRYVLLVTVMVTYKALLGCTKRLPVRRSG